jgi:hypothetical protein
MALPKIRAVITADTKEAEAGFDRVERGLNDVGKAADRAATRTDAMGVQLNRTAGRSSAFGRGLQNASFQMADFASQVGAGTSASVALGQQLPQLLGGFGILGAVLGAVVAVAVPLTRAFQGMSEQGQDLSQVLGVLSPLAERLGDAFSTVAQVGVQMAEVIINNLDRILITAGLVAGFFAGKWVAAFVAARVATFSLAAALTTLRTALIRTGIGAVVVLAGEAVYQFTRLTSAVGSIGEAMGLLGDVAVEVWGRIKDGASAMVMSIKATFLEMEGSFLGAISRMAMKASDFFMSMSEGVANIPGMEGLAGGLMSASNAFLRGAASTSQAGQMSINQAGGMREQAAGLFAGLSGPLESVQKIRDLLASIKDERITLPDLLGVPGGDSEGGGKKKTPLEEQTEAQIASLQALRDQGRETWSALGTFLQQFAGKSKAAAIAAIAIQKGLSIAQIISNTAAAQMRALAELGPIAGPPVAAKMGLYGKLQAGLVAATGLAQAMGSGGSAGSASPSLGGGAGTTQPAQPPQPTQTVAINLQGDTFSRSSVEGLLEQIQSQLDRGGRLVFQ